MELGFRSVLAVAAHPDDLEFSVFGTLMRMPLAEKFLYVASVGNGASETLSAQRISESRQALETLPRAELQICSRSGLATADYQSILSDLEAVLDKRDCDLVLIPSQHDSHQEHRLLHEIAMSAVRRRRLNIWAYQSPSSSLNFQPRIFVDITDQYSRKRTELAGHKSQGDKVFLEDQFLESMNRNRWAALAQVRYSEAFELISAIL